MQDQVFCFSITELQVDPINPSGAGGGGNLYLGD